MIKFLLRPLYTVFFLLAFVLSAGAGELATFYRYSSQNGLSCNYVHDIKQDKNGFLWVATEYGLNRFDGVHFRNYYSGEYPSLFRNQVMLLDNGVDGRLMIGGNNGLLLAYNEQTDSFDNLMPDDFSATYYKGITNFYTDAQGGSWVCTTGGLYRYDSSKGMYDKVPCLTDSTSGLFISDMMIDHHGRFFCCTHGGINVFDKEGKSLRDINELLNFGSLTSHMLKVDSLNFLVSSFMKGIWLVSMSEDGTVRKPQKLDVPFENINAMIRDSKGFFWIGTSGNGLWRGTFRNGAFNFENVEPQNSRVDELKKIHCLFEDRSGDLWIGTQNAGLLRYSSDRNEGSVHSMDVGFPMVDGTAFAEMEDGRILVGADGHGLFLLSRDFQIERNYTKEDYGLPSNNVLAIKKDSKGDFWIAMWGGSVCKFDSKCSHMQKLTYDGVERHVSTTKDVTPMSNGEVWVATGGDGVYTRDTEGKWHKKILRDSVFQRRDLWTEHVCESSKGIRWIISSRTVWRDDGQSLRSLYPDVDETTTYSPLLMYQGVCDAQGGLYVVSNKGILYFEEDGSSYHWLDFLPDGEYASIVLDKEGVFWTGGTNGILSFDVEKKTYYRVLLDEQSRSRNYFTCRAAFVDSKGRLYFGSTDGFVMFNPSMVRGSNKVDYLSFSQLTVMGRLQKVGDEYLPKRLSDLDRLQLNYDETNISVSVDVVDFSGLNDVEVSYRLRELDKDWINLYDRRDIKITHIPPGKYVLEVKASKKGFEEGERVITLPVHVSPPWWATWWFVAMCIFFVISIVSLILCYRFRNIVNQREKLKQMVLDRTKELNEKQQLIELRNTELEQALEEKDRLISVVAHDLKNPMFAIVSALDSVLKTSSSMEQSRPVLKDIYLSAFNLQTAMGKLLEWARGNRNELTCQLKNDSLKKTINEVLLLLRGQFESKNITVSSALSIDHMVRMDARMIGTAIRNVLSNSVKFTRDGGLISISAVEEGDRAKLVLSDNGVGMNESQIEMVMSNKNVISTLGTNMEKGTGLGFQMSKEYVEKSGGSLSLESEVGKGTRITIYLPLTDELDIVKDIEEVNGETSFVVNRELFSENTVMIVDDDPLILMHLRSVLEPYVTVLECSNGEEGYEMALKMHPDVILSDVEMPVCNGIVMYERLRKEKETCFIPLLFLSARNEESARLMGLHAGAIDYISKPFLDNELLMKVTNILQLRRIRHLNFLKKNYEDGSLRGEIEETSPLVRKLMSIVESRYSDSDFSADDMASELAMSKSTFARKLKSITDKTPTEILTEYRLHKAKNLLQKGDVSVTEVAFSVGFNDPLYFSKKYKAYFGVNPSMQK